MVKHTWEKVADRKGDHRVFKNQTGRYAIADRSGATPDRTEDGIIWLVPRGSAEVYASQHSKRLMVCYTVHGEGGGPRDLPEETSTCHSGLHVLPFLAELRYDFLLSKSLQEDLSLMGTHVPLSGWATAAKVEEPEDQPTPTYDQLKAKIAAEELLRGLSAEHLIALAALVKAFK